MTAIATYEQPVTSSWTQLEGAAGASTVGPMTIQASQFVLIAFADSEPTGSFGFALSEYQLFYYAGASKVWAIDNSSGENEKVTFSV